MGKSSRAVENGQKGFRAVKQVLTQMGWEPEATDFEGVLRVDFEDDNIPIDEATAEIRMEHERFLFYMHFGDRVPSKYRNQVMDFITRANFGLATGNFEMNLLEGTVRFKIGIDFTNSELSKPMIRANIRSAMDVVEQYGDSLLEVMKGKKTPEKAIEEAERYLAAEEEESSDE